MKIKHTSFPVVLMLVIFAAKVNTAPAQNAVGFDGSNEYITFGTASTLGSSIFTLEAWIMKTGTGSTASTGTGGTVAIPIISKGRGESETPANKNMNYFLGLTATGFLTADFEDKINGGNHPVTGTSAILNDMWYHIAATYDGSTWRLYLNGTEDKVLVIGSAYIPENLSLQHAGLGTALNSTGVASGFFAGIIDEARIWNLALSQSEIQAGMNSEIILGNGLLGRWGLNEGVGISAGNSVIASPAGILTNGPSWLPGAPALNPQLTAPLAPSNLLVTSISNTEQLLSWTDNSDNETGFEIELSANGIDGPFSFLENVAANTELYNNIGLDPNTEYCYQVKATNLAGSSDYSNTDCEATTNEPGALDLGTGNAYVTFGNNPALGLANITLETWFRKEGIGTATSTGTGGVTAIPLLTKGRAEADNSNLDMNYFLGIRFSDNVLVGDFEEGAPGTSPGLNHPVVGSTPILDNTWYHAAATYDGITWYLYLNGNPEAQLTVGQPLRSDCIQHAGLGTAMNSTGVVSGHFDGVLDEVRIWNQARSLADIQSSINQQVSNSEPGLVARWGLNEGNGTMIHSTTISPPINGTIQNTDWNWISGAPFNIIINHPPDLPTIHIPSAGATGIAMPANIEVIVADQDVDNLTVNFYGRPVMTAAPTFSIVVLPDAQNYTSSANGGTPAMFTAQTQWCVDNLTSRNIRYVSQVGDITNDNTTAAWENANTSMSLLDNNAPGIPYGIALGNHDFLTPPTKYGNYFPASRFEGRPYYGGHFGTNNENHYEFFSSGELEFIVINLGSGNQNPSLAVLDWADTLLKTYGNKRAILVNHSILNVVSPATFTAPGQVIYDALKDNPNLFMMLCGHNHGEVRREDTFDGNKIQTVLADYQTLVNGGNGWLRIMEFDPASNVIHASTYSPTLNQFNNGIDSRFDIPYDMLGNSFQLIGSNSEINSGTNTSINWTGLAPLTEYEWYVAVSDGVTTTTSAAWSFTTGEMAGTETVLNLTSIFPQGLYTSGGNLRKAQNEAGDQFPGNTADQITVELHDPDNYPSIVYSSGDINLSTSGSVSFSVPAIHSGSYYVTVRHRNSIATVSAVPISFIGGVIGYAYDSPLKIFGSNLHEMPDGRFVIFAGDANQDGIVDSGDITIIDNNASNYASGYLSADLNGDGIIDSADLTIVDNNAGVYVTSITP
jgi:hypothetical protein